MALIPADECFHPTFMSVNPLMQIGDQGELLGAGIG
jgi:hypothetical protein